MAMNRTRQGPSCIIKQQSPRSRRPTLVVLGGQASFRRDVDEEQGLLALVLAQRHVLAGAILDREVIHRPAPRSSQQVTRFQSMNARHAIEAFTYEACSGAEPAAVPNGAKRGKQKPSVAVAPMARHVAPKSHLLTPLMKPCGHRITVQESMAIGVIEAASTRGDTGY